MNINNKPYHTIWLKDDDSEVVQLIDQTKLPFEFSIRDLSDYREMVMAIKDMWVRGAPLIGVAGAFGVYLACIEAFKQNKSKDFILKAAQELRETRPTAVNLMFAIDEMVNALNLVSDIEMMLNIARKKALELKQFELDNCYSIGKHGMELIKAISEKKNGEPVNILTHCNAGWLACIDYGTATAPIYLAHEAGIQVHVWVDETRPRNQGARLTAWELGQHGVQHTLIPDNTGGHLMQHGKVDMVIVGSDRTTVTGDVANKIGTYLKALAANDNNIPFYVALPSSTIDWTLNDGVKEIPIEQRSPDEVTYMEGVGENGVENVRICPEFSPVVNYGFDVTPARLVKGLITERGVCPANKEAILDLYPEKEV